jgi:hypothetical protein
MAVSKSAAIELIDRTIARRGAAGIAVVSGTGAPADVVWLPASLLDEPAYLAYSITRTTVCAMCAVEGDAIAEQIVLAVLDTLRRAP